MAYAVQVKIRPVSITDLTVTSDLHTYTLDDFSEVDGWLEGGVRYVSNTEEITFSSTGYGTQTIIASALVENNEVTLVAEMQDVEILSDGTNNYQISDKVARAELLNKADISDIPTNYVTTDTTQNITAKKVLGGNNLTMISQSGITKGTNPASTQYINFGLMGTDTSAYTDRLGCLETSVDASGNVITYLRAYKNTASSSIEAHVTVNYPVSGSPYATAPTPTEDTNNSVQIDTVGARNTKLQNYALSSILATVATSGSYNDLSNKPTIPTVNNATLTIQKNGTTVKTFTANASTNVTANITVPTKTSDITNDSGYITGINSSDVTTALGYTPQTSITGAATTITGSNLTTNRALISNGSGKVAVSDVTSTELGYLDGVTSAIQTQLNDRITTTTKTVADGGCTFALSNGLKIITTEVSFTAGEEYSWSYGTTFSNTPKIFISRRSGATATSGIYDAWVRGSVGKSSCSIYCATNGTFMLMAIGN